MKQPEILKGNKFLLLINIKNDKTSGSKRFVSSQNFLQLGKKLEDIFTNGEGREVILKLVDKDNHHVKTIKVKMEVKGRETIDNIKLKLMNLDKIIDIPDDEKYRIIIENCQSSKIDKRSFSMRFKGPIEECYTNVKHFFDNLIEEINDDDIVFQGHKPNKNTHRVLIHKSGTAANYLKFNSKSFSINLQNYSSEEIIDIVRDKLITKMECKK